MFSRTFMKTFPVMKYARQSGASGSISTDIAMMGSRDLIPFRATIFIFSAMVTVMAYSGFDFFYEAIRHVPGPHFHATWEDSVPESVKGPNDHIIESFNKLQEVRTFIKTVQPEK